MLVIDSLVTYSIIDWNCEMGELWQEFTADHNSTQFITEVEVNDQIPLVVKTMIVFNCMHTERRHGSVTKLIPQRCVHVSLK